jgi:hypothetical protein
MRASVTCFPLWTASVLSQCWYAIFSLLFESKYYLISILISYLPPRFINIIFPIFKYLGDFISRLIPLMSENILLLFQIFEIFRSAVKTHCTAYFDDDSMCILKDNIFQMLYDILQSYILLLLLQPTLFLLATKKSIVFYKFQLNKVFNQYKFLFILSIFMLVI